MGTPAEQVLHHGVLQDHWVRRIVAAIIDFILVWVGLLIIFSILGALAFIAGALGPLYPYPWYTSGLFAGGFFLGLLGVLYFVVLEGGRGTTLGKSAMGFRVRATSGPMDYGKALVRNLSKIYWLLLIIDLLLGFITSGDPRQRFLDRVAGTVVVRTGPEGIAEEQFRATPSGTWAASPSGTAPPPPAVAFCSACGTRLAPRADGRMACPNCGALF